MKKIISLALISAAAPQVAVAAQAGHHSPGIETLTLPAINFVLYFLLAIYLYKKHVAKIVRQRAIDVRSHVQKAANEVADANKERSLIEARQADLDAECDELKRSYHESALKVSESIIAEAKQQCNRIENDSDRQVENEIAQAKKLIRYNVVRQAAEIARQSVKDKLTGDADRKLRLEAVESLLEQAR